MDESDDDEPLPARFRRKYGIELGGRQCTVHVDGRQVRSACARPGLYCARTTLVCGGGQRVEETGLFTSAPLRAGAFLCLYNGRWYDVARYESLPEHARLNEYAVQLKDERGSVIVAPPFEDGEKPSPFRYPASMANEPPPGRAANAVLLHFHFLLDEIDVDPRAVADDLADEEFVAVGLVACRPLAAHEEIFWNYGKHYDRRYKPGKGCRAPRDVEDPTDVLERIPADACSVSARRAPAHGRRRKRRGREGA